MSEPARGLVRDALPDTREPVRVAARRLRWFRAALGHHLDQLGAALGCRFALDDAKLAGIFVRWLRAVEAQRPADPAERRAFFEFAAGLMLRELVADMPLRAAGPATGADPGSAAAFWPEGYACVTFCLAVMLAAVAQEFDEEAAVAPAIDDLRSWWSFRENAAQDPAVSVGFIELLLGHEPNWLLPGVFSARLHRELGPKPRLAS